MTALIPGELGQRELKSIEPTVELAEVPRVCMERKWLTPQVAVTPPETPPPTPQVAVNNLEVSTEAEPREHAWQPAELLCIDMFFISSITLQQLAIWQWLKH